MQLRLRLTPHGHLVCETAPDAPILGESVATRLSAAFTQGSGQGLLHLGAAEVGRALPPVFSWWRNFAAHYVAGLCVQGAVPGLPTGPPPAQGELATLVLTAPMMVGAEYLTPAALHALWVAIGAAVATSLAASGTALQDFLKRLNPTWNLVGRVHFNLAENRRDAEAPFAFIATYTTEISQQGRTRHLPLHQALREYAANRPKLLSLLLPVKRATETCAWLRSMVASGKLFQPLRWTPVEAAQLLRSTTELERAGIVVRMPAAWRAGRPPRPRVMATVGTRAPSKLGLDGLLDFSLEMTLDGERLTEQEIKALLAGTDGLVLLRGRWIEVDPERLQHTLQQFQRVEETARTRGLTFAEAMRLLAGCVFR